jgi:hypothetical protein
VDEPDGTARLERDQVKPGQFGGRSTDHRVRQSNRRSRPRFDAKSLVGRNPIESLKEEVILALGISVALIGR